MMQISPINIQTLKRLVEPTDSRYYKALYAKCEALYKERERLAEEILFKNRPFYKKQPTKHNAILCEQMVELEEFKTNLMYWQTKFERQFSVEIIQSIINMLSGEAEAMEYHDNQSGINQVPLN